MDRILIVDEDSREALAHLRLLRSAFYDAERAADGLDALRRHSARPYDLVVIDVSTERGLWTLRRLVRDDRGVRILAVARGTPAPRDEMLRRGSALGAADALPKPVELKRFLAAVEDLLLARA